ncbi:MAG: ferritin-like domain-containing protein [Halobacteriovoraceae bacterium]|nr:ferritin-like domain-containing protein [Halobacteriovoraceae bacterium]
MLENFKVDLQAVGEKGALKGLLQKKFTRELEVSELELESLWTSNSYGLDKVDIFKGSQFEIQKEILKKCALSRLEEAYHIEKAGMAYGGKMIVLGDSLEERKFYATFVSEEAQHFHYLEEILGYHPIGIEQNAFVKLLENLIEVGAKRPLIFIVQILLEGWGLEHYQKMASECTNTSLISLLGQILKDEASHHGSGLVLFNKKDVTLTEKNFILDTLKSFFQMVQVGPVAVLQAIENAKGHLSQAQKITILEQIGAYETTAYKLEILKRLMLKAGCNDMVDYLESDKLKPFSYSEMVRAV